MRPEPLRSLLAMALVAACQQRAPEAQRPASSLTPAAHGAEHADPALPFTLDARSVARSTDEAEVSVRVTARVALPRVTLGVTLPQELSPVGASQQVLPSLAAGATASFTARVRRTTPGAAGVTLRAWVEARGEGIVLGDERALVLFGAAPAAQPALVERVIPGPDGGALHETVIP